MKGETIGAWLTGHVAIVMVLGAMQCPRQPTPASADADSTRVARLEREARALAKATGCGSAEQCRAAPVGERPCGGPRDYVVYCARSTDTSALNRKLAELRQAEMDLNRKTGAMSTCEFRMPPETTLVGGSCRAR
jgi:hypothetical protein